MLWAICFAFSIAVVVASTLYALHAYSSIGPTIARHGLDTIVTTEGKLLVGTLAPPGGKPRIPVKARVAAVDGQAVPHDLVVGDFAKLLSQSRTGNPTVSLQQPDGRISVVSLRNSEPRHNATAKRDRSLRFWARLSTALLACSALLVCSLVLVLRRPHDPVAMLLAFAFLGMAASIDPPMQLWMWTDHVVMLDVISLFFFYPLLLALATFPDGVFVPRFWRWLIPLGIPLTVLLSITDIDEDVSGIVGISILLAVVGSLFFRFRREPKGIARQQIKWAGFGFALGLLLIFGAALLAAALGDDPSTYSPLMALSVLVLFSCGMAVIPLGLLIALTRFRLWEADSVITRSAAYAVVTLFVGVIWAASADLVKLLVGEVLGSHSQAGATAISALLAAGIFSPTQSVVLGWTRRRFGTPLDRIKGVSGRLNSWGLTETPEEIATRALSLLDETIHPTAAAIAMDNVRGLELLAARGTDALDDPRLIERIALADEEGNVGTVLLSRRSDGNRYNRHELEAVRALVPALAEALRVSRSRLSRDSQLQQRMEEMAARLAQLEGGVIKPA